MTKETPDELMWLVKLVRGWRRFWHFFGFYSCRGEWYCHICGRPFC